MIADVQVSGLSELHASLGAATVAIRQPKDALSEVYARWLAANRARFAGSAAWVPLAPVTARKKAKRGKSTEPLAGGPLEESLTRAGTPGAVGRIEGSTLTMGTARPEANAVKNGRGTRGERGYMPPRRPVLFDRGEQRQAANIVGTSITTTLLSGKTRTVRPRGV